MWEKNVETVRRVYEGVNARLEVPSELFDPDYEFDNTELWPDIGEVLGSEAAGLSGSHSSTALDEKRE